MPNFGPDGSTGTPQGGGSGGGVVNALASVYSALQSRWNVKAQAKANKNLAEYSYGKDLDMWNRMNEYNSPAAQMERWREAGLNPHLIYGQGTPGNASDSPKYRGEAADFSQRKDLASGVIQAYQMAKMRKVQTDNIEAATQNTKARTATEIVRKSKYLTDSQKAKIELNVARQLEGYNIDIGKSNAEYAKKKLSAIDLDIKGRKKSMLLKDAQIALTRAKAKWEKLGLSSGDRFKIKLISSMLSNMGMSDMVSKILGSTLSKELGL